MRTVTPQQWARISELFNEASRLLPEYREAFLAEVCPDEAIRREVHSLLAQPTRVLGIDSTTVTGRTLLHYRILEQAGHGNMGQVYRAHDMKLNRTVALKLVPSDVRGDSSFRERLIREAKLASQLNHPNIVVIHEIAHDEAKDLDFIVMEFVAGRTLGEVIPPEGLPVDLSLHYAIQIASALAATHDSGILHGDLKPSNIMVTEADDVRVVDFGLARNFARQAGDPRKSDVFGTIKFMAPERQGVRLTDPRSEIFSFGLILHQMLGGVHPFGNGTADEVSTAIQNELPLPLPPRVPAWLSEITLHCLERNPAHRFQSMREVFAQLTLRSRIDAPETVKTSARTHADVERIRTIIGRVTYNSVAKSRQALTELASVLASGASEAMHAAATAALTDLIMTLDVEVSGPVRKIRQMMLEGLKASTAQPLREVFEGGLLDTVDLYGMDFANANLEDTSFSGCFLVEANFRASKLLGASFVNACIRNVDFTDADLAEADFTEADWFNAAGLTEGQLRQARRGTFRECPPDIRALRSYLGVRYVHPFDSWSTGVQRQLQATWAEYLKPGGLRDIVAKWQHPSR